MDENYTKVHQAFLHACIRHGVLSTKQTLQILTPIQSKYGNGEQTVDEAYVQNIVDEINAKFTERNIEQRLNFIHYEWDHLDGDFLVFCNTFASVGLSPVYNEAECLYMKNVMEKIIMSDTHSMSIMAALNLISPASSQPDQSQSSSKKLTKQRAEEILDEWSAAGYFITVNENLTLGPMGIGEYRETFRTKFNDYIQSCKLCNEITLQPYYCPNDECEIQLDKRCFKNYVQKKKKCPACKSNWEEVEVSET